MSFRVVTYNILAQAYVKQDRYPNSPPETLAPAPRRALLLQQLQQCKAEIYALQEVEPEAHAAIAEALGPGFQGLYAPRRGRPDGSSIFFSVARFALAGEETLHFTAHDPGDDQLALIAHLVALPSGERLSVASTHLRWQPNETAPEKHVGRLQLVELLERASQESEHAWLLVGDFNAIAESPVLMGAFARGWQESCRSQRPWDTTYINGRRRKLDYLLYRPGQLQPSPGVLPALDRHTPMPSYAHPSDHLPVQVDYTFVR